MRFWTLIKTAALRLVRHAENRCLVCGRGTPIVMARHIHRYCSLECAAYDGALNQPTRSRILTGVTMPPKPHHEAWMDEE